MFESLKVCYVIRRRVPQQPLIDLNHPGYQLFLIDSQLGFNRRQQLLVHLLDVRTFYRTEQGVLFGQDWTEIRFHPNDSIAVLSPSEF